MGESCIYSCNCVLCITEINLELRSGTKVVIEIETPTKVTQYSIRTVILNIKKHNINVTTREIQWEKINNEMI